MSDSGAVSRAVATGERLTALQSLAARLAADLDASGDARVVAPLSARLMDVLQQIDDLGGGVRPARKATGLDEFTSRLAARKAAPSARCSRVG